MRASLKVFLVLALLAGWNSALAGSTSTSTVVKDGKKITTKVTKDNDGTTTTVVTTKDKDGTVTTTTTVTDKDGNIVSTDDPNARAKAAEEARQRKEQQEALAKAPKRGAGDPLQAVLFQTVVSEQLRKASTKEGVFPYFRKEFEGDPVIKLLDQQRVDGYAKGHDFKTGKSTQFSSFDRGPEFLPADVYVESWAALEEKVGINKATNKLAKAPFLTYRAVIHSEYSDKTWEVKEEGHILQNPQVTKAFADKVKAVLKGEAGAIVPAEAQKFRRGGAAAAKGDQFKDAMKGLFKKKK